MKMIIAEIASITNRKQRLMAGVARTYYLCGLMRVVAIGKDLEDETLVPKSS